MYKKTISFTPKRIIAFALALVMALGMMPALSYAAGVAVTTDKAAYTVKEEIKVTVAGATAGMESDKAFVSIQKRSARPSDYGSPWKYVRDLYESGYVWTVAAPESVGEYEIRFDAADRDYDSTLVSRAPITVTYINDEIIEIRPDKAQYTPNEEMSIAVTGFTKSMEDMKAFVSVAKKNDRPENYGTWKYVRDLYVSGGVWTVNAPSNVGEYEIRFYAADKDHANSLALKVPMSVAYATSQATATPDKSAVRPKEQVKITVAGVTEAQKSVKAFVSIAKKNDRPENYGSPWKYVRDLDITNGVWTIEAPSAAGEYEIRLYGKDADYANSMIASAPLTVSEAAAAPPAQGQGGNMSSWAVEEIAKADALGLIPDALHGADFTKPITRAEFAAVSVRAYEAMSGKKAVAAPSNPFTDTSDPDVLKAYNAGITTGVSADKFDPKAFINREQTATMLTRVLKKALIEGWNIGADGGFTLQYAKPAPFADDADISSWAKDSVYFMAANGIINGVGGNKFAPKNTTTEEELKNYANATREQALIIAARMTENLKDKPLDYTAGAAQPQQPTAPTEPTTPSGGSGVSRRF
jgi:hypothetical protein